MLNNPCTWITLFLHEKFGPPFYDFSKSQTPINKWGVHTMAKQSWLFTLLKNKFEPVKPRRSTNHCTCGCLFTSNSKQTTKTWCCYKSFDKKHIPPKHWNTGLVSSGVSLTSWWDGDSLALFGYLSSDSITIEISYVVDAILYQWTSHPIFSYFIHENWMRIYC